MFMNFETQLKEIVNKIVAKKVVIINYINKDISKNIHDKSKIKYLNTSQMGFVSCINECTRLSNSSILIDHIFIKKKKKNR